MLSKRSIRCIFTFIIAVCVVSSLAAAPKVEFVSETLDFGKVVCGNPIKATFTIKNVGDSELEIKGVRPSCGCMKAEAIKPKLAPGDSTTIVALFRSAGFNGPVNKSITVTTNDPQRDRVTLIIKADIAAVATMKPERLNFGSIKANESRTHLLLIYPGDPETFKITKIQPRGTHVSVPSFRKVKADTGDYWELTVLVKADDKAGRIIESISIQGGSDEASQLLVMVYGNIVK